MGIQHKRAVLATLNGGVQPEEVGNSIVSIRGRRVHVRFCGTDADRPHHFKFNVNANTLRADFELWICGSSALYYLLPVSAVRSIFNDRRSYPDRTHEVRQIKMVTVLAARDFAQFRRGAGGFSIGAFRCATVA